MQAQLGLSVDQLSPLAVLYGSWSHSDRLTGEVLCTACRALSQ